jgi:hypothetical protein
VRVAHRRDAGADVDELPDAAARQVGDRPAQEPPVTRRVPFAAARRSTSKLWEPPSNASYTRAGLGLSMSTSSGAHSGRCTPRLAFRISTLLAVVGDKPHQTTSITAGAASPA